MMVDTGRPMRRIPYSGRSLVEGGAARSARCRLMQKGAILGSTSARRGYDAGAQHPLQISSVLSNSRCPGST